jgi:nucleotide-binding universal stress UspA family protein
MNPIQRILVPTDLSERSRAGLRSALALAAQNHSELLVLHVARGPQLWQIPDEFCLLDTQWIAWEVDRVISEARLDLNNFLQPHRHDFATVPAIRSKAVLGPVASRIIDAAYSEEADLIVMSPKPHGAVKRFFSRSITDQITREAPCPVLSVRPPRTERYPRGRLRPIFPGVPQGSHA